MADKKPVALVLRRSPLSSSLAAEGLRQAVGLTLAENSVRVFLLGDAVWLATGLEPQAIGGEPVPKHLEALAMLGVGVAVERESLRQRGLGPGDLRPGVGILGRRALARALAEAEAAYAF